MFDFVFLIMNCERYREKAELQKRTWLKEINIPYFHVIGNENLEMPYKFIDKTLYVRTPDDYISLPKKVIAAYEAIHREFNYRYIFKTDDDQMLICPIFIEMLILHLDIHHCIHYGGKIVKTEEHISKYWQFHPELPKDILIKKAEYCNGRFYILSREAVHYLLSQKEKIGKEYFEDYAIGYNLDPVFKSPIFEIPNDIFVDM